MINRRLLLSGLLSATALGAKTQGRPPVVTLLGDSITAGLGLSLAQSLPGQLQLALQRAKVLAIVRGAGVSGDTTAGGLARLDFSVAPDTKVCVIELGANDYFQAVDPHEIKSNLLAMVRRLKARGVETVLAASHAPRSGSGPYGRAFDAVFPDVARRSGAALAPDLLAGVLDRPGFRQADGLHPNAAGAAIIAARLEPFVANAIRRAAPD